MTSAPLAPTRHARRFARQYDADLLAHAADRLWRVWQGSHLPPWVCDRTARLAADCRDGAALTRKEVRG